MEFNSTDKFGHVSFEGREYRLDTGEDAEVICEELTGKSVETLVLQGNTFGIEAAERVGLELAHQGNLKEAHFKDIFTSRGREEVPVALNHLLKGITDSGAQLKLLDLSDNAIGPIGAPSVIRFLESSSADTLEKLYINNCGMGPEGSSTIAAFIPKLQNLREFICGRNRLENKGATSMAKALSELKHLKLLRLNQNGIGVEGIKKLVDVLRVNRDTIEEVDLSDNTILPEGAEALANVLESLPKLRTLRVDDALVQNEGFTHICHALARSQTASNTMVEVTFEGNEISGQRIIDLIESIFAQSFHPEFTLNLLENEFSQSELMRLKSLEERFSIIVDDPDSDDDDDDNEHATGSNDESDESNGYVEIGDMQTDMREVTQDFITLFKTQPYNEALVNSGFMQLISTGVGPNNYQAVQILCEELGLMKFEQTRKKKPIQRDAIVYIGKRLHELPKVFKDFFQVVVMNNEDLDCAKILFDKLEI